MSGSDAARPPLVRELSAGGLVYRRTKGGVAVCLGARRRDGTLLWSIPKGHVERGEHVAAAAVREVREETGLAGVVEALLGDVTYWYARRDEAGRPVRVLKRVRFFLLRHDGGRFADRDRELDAVGWVPLAEAEATVAYPSEREIVRRARVLLEVRHGEGPAHAGSPQPHAPATAGAWTSPPASASRSRPTRAR